MSFVQQTGRQVCVGDRAATYWEPTEFVAPARFLWVHQECGLMPLVQRDRVWAQGLDRGSLTAALPALDRKAVLRPLLAYSTDIMSEQDRGHPDVRRIIEIAEPHGS